METRTSRYVIENRTFHKVFIHYTDHPIEGAGDLQIHLDSGETFQIARENSESFVRGLISNEDVTFTFDDTLSVVFSPDSCLLGVNFNVDKNIQCIDAWKETHRDEELIIYQYEVTDSVYALAK